LELVLDELKLLCEIHISPNTFVHVAELGLENNIPSIFYGDGTYCCTFGGSMSKSCIYYFASYWTWNFGSLGHLWCSCLFDLYSCLGEIGGLRLDLGNMDFSFRLWFYCCCFLSNYVACWGLILPLNVISSCLFYLFCKVFLSSSTSNWDIIIVLMIVLIFGFFSFLGEMCVGFKSLLFLMNLSLILSLLLLSSCGCFACFFFSCGFALSSGKHFWNITYKTMAKWHTSFFNFHLVVLSIIFF